MIFNLKNKQKNNFKLSGESDAGFMMTEILIVISIVILFSAIIISNFPQIKLQFAISRVTYKFTQDLRSTQNLSLSSVQYKDSYGQQRPINGYGVYVDINSLGDKKYIIYADCAYHVTLSPNCPVNGNQQYDALDYVIDTIDFSLAEPGVVIKQLDNVFGNKASINFSPPNPDTTITSLDPSFNQYESRVDIVFALSSDLTKTRTVSVNTSGLIEVK